MQTQETNAKSDMQALETRAVTAEAAQESNATTIRELQTTIEGLSTSALFKRTQELSKQIRDLETQLHRLGPWIYDKRFAH
ncbi:hypothetical protein SDRG_07217 [Saprolegnia diclina VS20]|uniref:Uncharacterized protein n=1 Tax=Saprolegnia diclina (strain VS20) TaxID=1156394 RepID=T0QCB4_SAPDV|nr:hypothetical protein SDRG_07217 [Saprolegnia diclina VS20]EQC35509.1 hypothetical protein SDRG_07217 [Saprolegnia diclina VS20]|eukprot:XP_008611259.1 hypothetical protein SDRG_07217 [Saprolegnia diclina VS20]